MPALLTRLACLHALAALLAAGCSRAPEGAPPVVPVDPVAPAEVKTIAASPAGDGLASSCTSSFVEVVDGQKFVRFELGRELVANRRGARHAFAEEVIHQNGQVVFHLEALAHPDRGGHVSITLTDFMDPKQLPAVFDKGSVEYMPLGARAEREERILGAPKIELTAFGPEGDWVEGTFGPSAESTVGTGRGGQGGTSFSGRFRVCRTKDWRVRI